MDEIRGHLDHDSTIDALETRADEVRRSGGTDTCRPADPHLPRLDRGGPLGTPRDRAPMGDRDRRRTPRRADQSSQRSTRRCPPTGSGHHGWPTGPTTCLPRCGTPPRRIRCGLGSGPPCTLVGPAPAARDRGARRRCRTRAGRERSWVRTWPPTGSASCSTTPLFASPGRGRSHRRIGSPSTCTPPIAPDPRIPMPGGGLGDSGEWMISWATARSTTPTATARATSLFGRRWRHSCCSSTGDWTPDHGRPRRVDRWRRRRGVRRPRRAHEGARVALTQLTQHGRGRPGILGPCRTSHRRIRTPAQDGTRPRRSPPGRATTGPEPAAGPTVRNPVLATDAGEPVRRREHTDPGHRDLLPGALRTHRHLRLDQGQRLRDRAEGAGWPEPGTAKVGRILGIVGTIIVAV